jgi:hypothetical protein
MRWAILCVAFALTACAGGRGPAPVARPQVDTRQCLASLDRAGVRYKRLPDRDFSSGCRIRGAVQLLDIGMPVTNLGALTCPVAGGLAGWVRAVRGLAQRHLRSDLVRVESFGSYACRLVNSRAGARLSEHSFANAVDIAAFVLADGRRVTVKAGWNGADPAVRDFLREAHRAGCRLFVITIGPDGDSFHADHFHMDMGRGPYCR